MWQGRGPGLKTWSSPDWPMEKPLLQQGRHTGLPWSALQVLNSAFAGGM